MDLVVEDVEIEQLEPTAIFGFDGKVASGLKVHPNKTHLVFPLGTRVALMNVQNNRQEFLCGHTNTISAIDVSPRYVGLLVLRKITTFSPYDSTDRISVAHLSRPVRLVTWAFDRM